MTVQELAPSLAGPQAVAEPWHAHVARCPLCPRVAELHPHAAPESATTAPHARVRPAAPGEREHRSRVGTGRDSPLPGRRQVPAGRRSAAASRAGTGRVGEVTP